MADRPFAVVGDGNFSGNSFTNVGHQTKIYNIYPPERQIYSLESRVSFDALLNSEARYPPPKCHAATRKEAQKVVKNWLCRKGEGSEKGIMWMSGAPGVGKSAIAQTVCEELCCDDGSKSWLTKIVYRDRYVDGSFFFARGMENREKASFFPATIAFQLRRSRTSCRTAIDNATEKRPEILNEDFPSQFRQLLIKAAQTTGFLQGPVTVVIDGLDECNSAADQIRLLELVLEAVKAGNMRFFIASRPEQHIHAFFHRQGVSQHTCQVRLDEETFNTSQDIAIFLREEFARIRQERPEACPRLPNGQEWPGSHFVDYLTVKSDSQFMFPILAIGFIDTPFFPPDKQLQILLAAPPSHTFSTLDNLYHTILSRRPHAEYVREDDLREYQEVVMGVLRVIIAWPGNPLTAAQIALVLHKPVEVVQNVVRGPMRALFKFYPTDHDSPITLCHKSLRDYLLDYRRSEDFFIPSAEPDDLFIAILSHPQSSQPSHPNILVEVLATVADARAGRWSVPRIAGFLGVHTNVVEHVVSVGPTSLLFNVNRDGVNFCASLDFRGFLSTAGRSGVFFSHEKMDPLCFQLLARHISSHPSNSYSKDVLLDILAVTYPSGTPVPPTICQIAALLELDSSLVEYVVACGGAQWLFRVDALGRVEQSCAQLHLFLQHPNQCEEFFVSSRRLDHHFARILSRQPPSEATCSSSQSRSILTSVLAVVMAFEDSLRVGDIASLTGIDLSLVEHMVHVGLTKPLFCINDDGFVSLVVYLYAFLRDIDRSGVFFISNEDIDAVFTRILSPRSYPRHVLVDMLALTAPTHWNCTSWPRCYWRGQTYTIRQIAASLGFDSSLVEQVAECGSANRLFEHDQHGIQYFQNSRRLFDFILDADRSGEFFVSDRRLDPLFIQILSRIPPSDALRSVITGVLTAVIALEGALDIGEIASVIDVDPSMVEDVVSAGPTSVLFQATDGQVKFITPWIQDFLQDATRSGEFFVPACSIDAFHTRFISQIAPPYSQSRHLLSGILTVLSMSEKQSQVYTTSFIAWLLNANRCLVEDLVFGPAKKLFFRDGRVASDRVRISDTSSLRAMLRDANRSGEFCITDRKKDALLIRTLTQFSHPDPSHPCPRDLLMDILTGMVCFPLRVSVSAIASALQLDTQIIKDVMLAPPEQDPHFIPGLSDCLQPFLLDADRSGEFFISRGRTDGLFTRILSSQPVKRSSSCSRDTLMDVLSIMANSHPLSRWTAGRLAACLDVSPTTIEEVVHSGQSRILFQRNYVRDVVFSTPLLAPFLKDASRSGRFFVSDRSIDPCLIRILSSPSHPGSRLSNSRDVLRDVLTMALVVPERFTVPEVAAALDVSQGLVEGVIEVGLTRLIFSRKWWNSPTFTFSTSSFAPFLRDVQRSGEFYISDANIDALFIRIITLPPLPHLSYPKEVLIGTMTAILVSSTPLTIPQIANILDTDRCLVRRAILYGPAKVLFTVDDDSKPRTVTIRSPFLEPFLCDATRSGEFFIPPTASLDTIPKPWLHRFSDESSKTSGEGREDDVGDDDAMEVSGGTKKVAKGKEPTWKNTVVPDATSSESTSPGDAAVIKRKLSSAISLRKSSQDEKEASIKTKRQKMGRQSTLDDLAQESEVINMEVLQLSDTNSEEDVEGMLVDDKDIWEVGDHGGHFSKEVDEGADKINS